ncbi:site-specific recombinase XerD [Paraburkholderia fungorum]|uniref:Site-specific recombinase XerD n=1 Tax=Paraburkholderia fungorum TaxID=134537 RepID=A0AAW3UUD7_9BURK|nr:site-specific recombinase XerD [Paraburkholderia fungorum]MBB6201222.1 site-specific recombinase XerD [Paraburkholderia fungorum]
MPDLASLAALRAWQEGLTARAAVTHYLGHARNDGQSSRGMIARIRRQLAACAAVRQRDDLIPFFTEPAAGRTRHAAAVSHAIDVLRATPVPTPNPADPVERWLVPRAARALRAAGIVSLAELMLFMRQRRRWWQPVPGLGATGAQAVMAFFDGQPGLLWRAAQLVARGQGGGQLLPVGSLAALPAGLDGSQGRFRAPRDTCGLAATSDVQAIGAWLALHESPHTARAYRREAERLLLWAVIERQTALSSLTTEDAIAYRAFLRRPAPAARWTGPPCPRSSPAWRPFTRGLSPRSAAYALAVLRALFAWLMDQHYVVVNPFAGVAVRGARARTPFDAAHALDGHEWKILRALAERLERNHAGQAGWTPDAAQRLRFVLDFGYATGLRAHEFVAATLGHIAVEARRTWWLDVTGKGAKPGRVALPPLARDALRSYLKIRGLPVRRDHWQPATPLVGALEPEREVAAYGGGQPRGIGATRLRQITGEFFCEAADRIEARYPALAAKLRQASPHWLRHTHATHALEAGVELVAVRDNLRHASIATTSTYLHGKDAKRAHQVGAAFRRSRQHPTVRRKACSAQAV